MFLTLFACVYVRVCVRAYSTVDTSLLSNIQKLFSEKIEIFSTVEFSKVSVLTGIIKISLKVCTTSLGLLINL